MILSFGISNPDYYLRKTHTHCLYQNNLKTTNVYTRSIFVARLEHSMGKQKTLVTYSMKLVFLWTLSHGCSALCIVSTGHPPCCCVPWHMACSVRLVVGRSVWDERHLPSCRPDGWENKTDYHNVVWQEKLTGQVDCLQPQLFDVPYSRGHIPSTSVVLDSLPSQWGKHLWWLCLSIGELPPTKLLALETPWNTSRPMIWAPLQLHA